MDKIPPFKIRNPVEMCRQLGARIRQHRLARGWTQAELAERSGISLSTLKLMEREGKGSLQRLAKVAVILNLDTEFRQLFSAPPGITSLDDLDRSSPKRAPHRNTS